MSLYSGISFDKDEPTTAASNPLPSGSTPPATAVEGAPKKNWSSALAFAPIVRRPATKVKPPKASAALFFTPTPGVASGSQPTDAVRSAAPVIRTLPVGELSGDASGSSAPAASQPITADQVATTSTRALPALTLEVDSRKRPQPGQGFKGGGGGGKKKRKKGRLADNLPAFNPDEAYDPTKPNDIEAYLRWRTDQRRARERDRKEREMRRYESASGSSEGSYYSEDERDEAVKPSYKGGFAPPASYNEPATAPSPPPFVAAPAQVVPADLTGDEAYARRVALSQGRAPPPPSAPAMPLASSSAEQWTPSAASRSQANPSAASASIAASIQERINAAQARVSTETVSSPSAPAAAAAAESDETGWKASSYGWHNGAPAPSSGWNAPPAAPAVYASAPPTFIRPTDPRVAQATSVPSPGPPPVLRPSDSRRPNNAAPLSSAPYDQQLEAHSHGDAALPHTGTPSAWSGGLPFQQPHYPPPPPPTLHPATNTSVSHTATYPSAVDYTPSPPQSAHHASVAVAGGPPLPSASMEGGAPLPSAAGEYQRVLEEKRAAAAAIAARFKPPPSFGGLIPGTNRTLVGSDSKPSERQPGQEEDTRDFAVRMMEKWGHKEGQGLGVNAEGIVKPIEVVQSKPVKGKASGQSGGSQAARGSAAMGKVVSESTARKDAEDRARFGESSRIITLEHMLGSVAELDDEFSAEVADECSQHGVVERVIVHERSPAPPRSEDSVVVFVVFSGPAGAWQALRALNDRFFSGRSVIAKYYPEARFARGDRNL